MTWLPHSPPPLPAPNLRFPGLQGTMTMRWASAQWIKPLQVPVTQALAAASTTSPPPPVMTSPRCDATNTEYNLTTLQTPSRHDLNTARKSRQPTTTPRVRHGNPTTSRRDLDNIRRPSPRPRQDASQLSGGLGDADNPRETLFACDTTGHPLYRGDVRVDIEDAIHPAVRLRYLGGGNGGQPPRGYKHNRGKDFVHYPITNAQGVMRQATFVQVIMGPDPQILALMADSDKVYTRPLYAEPQVREAGKPHYAPEDMYAFVGGHSNQHQVDRTHEAEWMEQRLHALAQALGGVQGELTRSKFRLGMANTWDRITEAQEGWMGGIGPTWRRGRRS
ncbi:hypothetical protein EDB85DRAFT_2161867 [Lactarius pseudohatsudake]|nr:hypothetical protein EDB85DRAFT_2161867 [Lactarius pseudohatsudake]